MKINSENATMDSRSGSERLAEIIPSHTEHRNCQLQYLVCAII